MSYYIYFDESGKLDRSSGEFSYYAALGCSKEMKNFFVNENFPEIKNELHLKEFNLGRINDYLKVFDFVFKNKISINTFLVDNSYAKKISQKLEFKPEELRQLFYIKLPERLIYGIIRHIKKFNTFNIFIDKSGEYSKYSIEEKLFQQLNAQIVYRDINGKVDSVIQEDSKNSLLLQVVDVILGLEVFLIEKKYYSLRYELTNWDYKYLTEIIDLSETEKKMIVDLYSYNSKHQKYIFKGLQEQKEKLDDILKGVMFYTQGTIQKAELLYRLISEPERIKIFNRYRLYEWTEDRITNDISISEYLSEFFGFKTHFDSYNKTRILQYIKSNNKEEYLLKEFLLYLGYNRNTSNLVVRYLEELGIEFRYKK